MFFHTKYSEKERNKFENRNIYEQFRKNVRTSE